MTTDKIDPLDRIERVAAAYLPDFATSAAIAAAAEIRRLREELAASVDASNERLRRLRKCGDIIINEIGSIGPEDSETAAARAVEVIRSLRREVGTLTEFNDAALAKQRKLEEELAAVKAAFEEVASACGYHPDSSAESVCAFIESVRGEARESQDSYRRGVIAGRQEAHAAQHEAAVRVAIEELEAVRQWCNPDRVKSPPCNRGATLKNVMDMIDGRVRALAAGPAQEPKAAEKVGEPAEREGDDVLNAYCAATPSNPAFPRIACESFLALGPVPQGLTEDELIRGYTRQEP